MNLVIAFLLLLLQTTSVYAVANKSDIYSRVKKKYDLNRKNPEKLASWMNSVSANEYTEHLKKNNIKTLPQMDVLPSGLYIPSEKLRLEYIETNFKLGTMIWKINGKEFQWKYTDSFSTRIKSYEKIFSEKTALQEIINLFLPKANAQVPPELPISLRGTLLENIFSYAWWQLWGDASYADVDTASKAICDTTSRESESVISSKSPRELITELQWMIKVQENYANDVKSACQCLGRTGDRTSYGNLNSCEGKTLSRNSLERLCEMQTCMNNFAEKRLQRIKSDPLYSRVPNSCFFETIDGVKVINYRIEEVVNPNSLADISQYFGARRTQNEFRQKCYPSSASSSSARTPSGSK